jgi:hypothetical protein
LRPKYFLRRAQGAFAGRSDKPQRVPRWFFDAAAVLLLLVKNANFP